MNERETIRAEAARDLADFLGFKVTGRTFGEVAAAMRMELDTDTADTVRALREQKEIAEEARALLARIS